MKSNGHKIEMGKILVNNKKVIVTSFATQAREIGHMGSDAAVQPLIGTHAATYSYVTSH